MRRLPTMARTTHQMTQTFRIFTISATNLTGVGSDSLCQIEQSASVTDYNIVLELSLLKLFGY